MNWRDGSGYFVPLCAVFFGAPAAEALLLQPPPPSDVTDISFRYFQPVYSSWGRLFQIGKYVKLQDSQWKVSWFFFLAVAHLNGMENSSAWDQEVVKEKGLQALENVSDWKSLIKTFITPAQLLNLILNDRSSAIFIKRREINEESVLQVFGLPLWWSMKHMVHVCFSETCAIFFVDSKYVLTKSVEVTKK